MTDGARTREDLRITIMGAGPGGLCMAIKLKEVPLKAGFVPASYIEECDPDGLMLAGRNISGGFIAHSSYRVTGNSVAMGEAAGVTCAVAAKNKALPHEVPFEDLGVKPVA